MSESRKGNVVLIWELGRWSIWTLSRVVFPSLDTKPVNKQNREYYTSTRKNTRGRMQLLTWGAWNSIVSVEFGDPLSWRNKVTAGLLPYVTLTGKYLPTPIKRCSYFARYTPLYSITRSPILNSVPFLWH